MSRYIQDDMQQIPGVARNFYERTLPDIYLLGGQSVSSSFDLSREDERLIATIQDNGMNNIMVSQELSKRNLKFWEDITEAGELDEDGNPMGLYAQPKPLKGMRTKDGRRWRPETYSRLVMAADSSSSYNFGVLAAAEQEGLDYVRVVDGNGCGWSDHNDPDTAHGKIVRLSEARSHPIAHPYCRRTFVVDDDTRGRKKAGRARKSIRVATAIGATTAATGLVGFTALKYSPDLQLRLTQYLERINPDFKTWRESMLRDGLREDNVISLADEWAMGSEEAAAAVPEWLVGATADRKVVGDAFESFTDAAMNSRYMSPDGFKVFNAEMAFGDQALAASVGDLGNFRYNIPNILTRRNLIGFDRVRETSTYINISDRVTGTMSRAVGEHIRFGAMLNRAGDISRYASVRVGQVAKYRISHIQAGLANRLILNPNGMLRAGFVLDPASGLISPNLRFLPKGPIRVNTVVSRSNGRYFRGTPIRSELDSVLKNKSIPSGDVVDAVHLDAYERAVEAGTLLDKDGWSITNPLLNVSDFLDGTVDDIIYDTSNGIIRRGRIKDALEYRDGQGNKVVTDLLIKDGRFVTRVDIEKGLVTSARTEVSLIISPKARVTVRTALDLAPLEIKNFSDLRHVTLPDLVDFGKDIRNRVRITGVSAELTAFGYTPFEMRKVLRYRWEDGVLLSRRIRNEALARVHESALQQEFFYRMLYDVKGDFAKAVYRELPTDLKQTARRIATDLNDTANETLYAFTLLVDSRRHLYRSIVKELDASTVKFINKTLHTLDDQYTVARREISNAIRSSREIGAKLVSDLNVDGIQKRASQLRVTARNSVEEFLGLNEGDVIQLSSVTDPDGVLQAAIPNLPRGDMVAHELGRIVSLTAEEISKVLNVAIDRAIEIWNEAMDALSSIIAQRWPSFDRTLRQLMGQPVSKPRPAPGPKATAGYRKEYNKFYDESVTVKDLGAAGVEDVRKVLPWLEDRFPAMKGRVNVRVDAGSQDKGVFAYVKPRNTTIHINRHWASSGKWVTGNDVVARAQDLGHFAKGEGSMRYVFVHEYGHVIHTQSSQVQEYIDREFMKRLLKLKRGTGETKTDLFVQSFRHGAGEGRITFLEAIEAMENASGPFVDYKGERLSWGKIHGTFISNVHNKSMVASLVGKYAHENWYELVAELFAQGMMGKSETKMSSILLEVMDDALRLYPSG